MIITISGTPGSGKSTVAEEIAKKLKLKHYSSGDLTRELAKKRGMSVLEFAKLEEKDENIDKEVDDVQIELGNTKDNFVIDSRLGYYFIPHSIKILLKCDPKEGAKRIFSDDKETRKGHNENNSLKTTEAEIRKRVESEKKRFKTYYGLDCADEKDYDLVIDTTNIPAGKAVEKILAFVKEFDKHQKAKEDEIRKEEEKHVKVMTGSEAKSKKKGNAKDAEDEDDFDDLDDEDDFDDDDFDESDKEF